jgi:hypothetical protein
MGVAVSLERGQALQGLVAPNGHLSLDDGTAIVSASVPAYTMDRLEVAGLMVGATLDCIVIVDATRDLVVDQISVVNDVHAETLRWLELSFQQQQQKMASTTQYSIDMGYPRRAVSPDDLNEIIQLDASPDEDQSGVALDDLSTVFGLDYAQTDNLIQELQMSGQIYRNHEGLYLPL